MNEILWQQGWEDKDYIHMRRDDTGGNNQGSGETPDQ